MGRASKDKRDVYYRKAKEEGYRARSAYKLLQIDEEFDILNPDNIQTGAVDLCAAPGSWSQVLSNLLFHRIKVNRHNQSGGAVAGGATTAAPPRIVAVDLQEMTPIEGVDIIQGDITSEHTAREIICRLNGRSGCSASGVEDISSLRRADIVVCDGAPDVTGMHELDEYLQHQLLLAALQITVTLLRPGGAFVTKMFRGPNTAFLIAKSELFFDQVRVVKPQSSRNASMESFLLCQGFNPGRELPADLAGVGRLLQAANRDADVRVADNSEASKLLPFLSCGDLSGYDADMCYDREAGSAVLPPVQPPIQAPYLSQNKSSSSGVAAGQQPAEKKQKTEH